MSTIGANGMKEVIMKLSALGTLFISVTPSNNDAEIMVVEVSAENRQGVISNVTNKDENVDQFVSRMKGIMRAMWNAEPRVKAEANGGTAQVKKTWEEEKAGVVKGREIKK